MANLIRSDYHLLPVLNRFGIRLGFKDKTVNAICTEKGINPGFFLAIVNTFHNKNYFPEEELLSFSPLLIVDYLKKTHFYYISYILPKMEIQLQNLVSGCSENCEELSMIEAFYKRYKTELLKHINEEEEQVFPYVEKLVRHESAPKKGYSITDYEKEHTNVEVQLNDLKNLVIKYLVPVYNDDDCNEFLYTLFNFEKDITDHARIEDAILVAQVDRIENQLNE